MPQNTRHRRVLGIAPSSRGVGFAVMEGKDTLVDWGIKLVKGNRNERSLANVADLLALYEPDTIAMEDPKSKGCRRASRIEVLIKEISELAEHENVRVKLFARRELRRGFFPTGLGTKQALAELLATRFSKELGKRTPRKRKLWMSQDSRMDMFDAVGLAVRCLKLDINDSESSFDAGNLGEA